ncbi:ROK family protein [Clostridium sp. Cult1]|uniref:ROK family protein n=1 Tax=Clostridium sp. Cult1 TaxID=2079002 RepID=UPI001F467E1F|nr:ROK family protein [Clostridium sp. Cult1]MCF6462972.1 glucokinase [Clostridium sp. Cult1]
MKRVIGVDLGGTSIYGGLINERGEILKRVSRATDSEGGRNVVLGKVKEVIEELIEDEKIEAIGLGSPGFIDVKRGEVLTIGGNIKGWAGTKIREELSTEFKGIPIFVENDANVAAICEEWLGSGKGLDSFIMLTLGTGVGGAIFSKKSGIWYGINYQGAELGHTILYPKGRLCGCGQRGCVEQYISGNAVENTYLELTGEKLKGKDIFSNYETDENSKKTVDKFIMDLGTYLISIKNIFDPEGIIIGGGVINSKEYWWGKMLDYYHNNCNSSKGTEILPAQFLNDAGMIGAAKVALDNI